MSSSSPAPAPAATSRATVRLATALLATALLVTVLLATTPLGAQGAAPSAALARVDSLLAARQLPAAVAGIDSALAAAPRDGATLWRASRVRLLQGDAASGKAQDRLYRDALALAERAIAADRAAPDGYLRRAAAAGKVALFAGILDAADFVVQARDDATRVLGMTGVPAATRASAHYILGRTHLKLTETPRPLRLPLGLGFGNLPDALTNLRTATELRPGFIMFELEYGRALAQDGQAADARARLQSVATLAEQEPGDAERKQEAQALLRTIGR
jgi:tetratricopeptide (TPR) repeat protein